MYKFSESNPMIPAEMLPWQALQTQTSIKSIRKIDYHPINSLTSSDTVNFELPTLSNFMVKNIQIFSEIQIDQDGEKPKKNMCFFNSNPAQSLWKHAELTFNNKTSIMNPMAQSYNLEAFFETIFNEDDHRSDKLLTDQAFLLDDVLDKIESEDMLKLSASTNAFKRSERISQNGTILFITDFNCSLIRQGKLLPTNLPMSISLTKNVANYVLIQGPETDFSLKIKRVFLRVTYVEPHSSFVNAFNSLLMQRKAIYECNTSEITTFSIPSGNTKHMFTNIVTGKLPHFMVFCIQDREAMMGNAGKNPFTFHPFKSIQIFIDNNEYFSEPLECDIENDDYTLMLNHFNEALGYERRGSCLINSNNFKTHFMVPVALSSDRTINRHHNLQRVVDFKVLLNFHKPTPNDQILLIYSSYDKLIQIDSNRTVELVQ